MTKTHNAHIREAFPILSKKIHQKNLIYFDNAATSQKPNVVIDAESRFYQEQNANVHRASHGLSAVATIAYEQARESVRAFINAPDLASIIWTSGTTSAINLVAQSWGANNLKAGDEVILTQAEHHANIVPWTMLKESIGINIIVLDLTSQGLVDLEQLKDKISEKTKLVCCHHVSNVIGKYNDIAAITALAHQAGALCLIDGAQSIAHTSVDVQAMDCDFYVFSAHKAYGPTGVGVLYGKKTILEAMPPVVGGGEMIKKVSFARVTYNHLPFKLEAGTPNIAGNIACAAALDFISENRKVFDEFESALVSYAFAKLSKVEGLNWVVADQPDIGIFSFTLSNAHNQDVATFLDTQGIAIRSGHHCAMPLMEYLQLSGCLRVSIMPYNTFAEIDALCDALTSYQAAESKLVSVADKLIEEVITPQGQHGLEGLTEPAQAVVERFKSARSWDTRHRQLMLLGKEFTRMTKEERSDNNLIEGCESKAWIKLQVTSSGLLNIEGDSDAKVIRGLLFIVTAAYHGVSVQQALQFNIERYFDELGLLAQLSPSRGNGLRAIVSAVIKFVKAHA